jgi:integrase
MAKTLTKRSVDALKPRPARYSVHDDKVPGFAVRVSPDGSKFFSLQYRGPTGRRRYNIGSFGDLTVDQARKLAEDARARIRHGGDPAAERDTARGAPTVAALGAEYLADVDARRKKTTATEYRRQWNKHIVPAFGAKRVAQVTDADVSRLHASLKASPYLANRVVTLIAAFFAFAMRQGWRQKGTNPAADVEPFRESSRERFLAQEEIARLGDAFERAEREGLPAAPRRRRTRKTGRTAKHRPKSADAPRPANPVAVAAIRFLLLTGWREQEALTLRWDVISFERSAATLPDTKGGKSERQLGAPAMLLLSELPRIEGSPYVFPGRRADRPLTEVRRLWCAVRYAAGLEDVRLHDLRHTFASVAAGGGGSLLIIGKLLGHRDMKSTQRYAHLADSPVKVAADTSAGQIAALLSGTSSTMRIVK